MKARMIWVGQRSCDCVAAESAYCAGRVVIILPAAQEASSRPGVLLAFIILDNPAASVLDMQAVSFAGGQPSFSKYLDSFPFPFYIILRDLAALPATLASLLRQWFELTAAGALS